VSILLMILLFLGLSGTGSGATAVSGGGSMSYAPIHAKSSRACITTTWRSGEPAKIKPCVPANR
jgi:hypothetical protein